MPTEWKTVRVPSDLAVRITRLGDEMMAAHVRGISQLPNEYCEHLPPHHVIERAIAEMEARRDRSRRPRAARNARPE